VALPRDLAAFLARVFPEGTDPLRAKYRVAVDLCAAMTIRVDGKGLDALPTLVPKTTVATSTSGTSVLQETVKETPRARTVEPRVLQETVKQTPKARSVEPDVLQGTVEDVAVDEADDTVETTRYRPNIAQQVTVTDALFTAQRVTEEERPLPRRQRRWLLPLIVVGALFLIVAVCLGLILALLR
jgi:hypothetical protein